MKREQGLIGRDDRFSRRNGIEDQAFRKIIAADEFHHDVHVGVREDLLGIIDQYNRLCIIETWEWIGIDRSLSRLSCD